MNVFSYLTPATYAVLVVVWAAILVFYARRLGHVRRRKEYLLGTLLVVLMLDAGRTIFESTFFGAWYTARLGYLPREVYEFLVRPEVVFVPKAVNLTVAILVILIIIRKWIPQEERELGRQRSSFEALIDAIPDALLLTDKERRITSVNKGFTQVFGYEPGEVIGQPTSMIYESEEEFLRQGRARYNLTAEQLREPYVVTYRRKDGTLLPGETIGTKIVAPDGEVLGFYGLIRDISARLQQDEMLRQSQKMEAIGTLSGGIAHDFNNILGAILGYASLMNERVAAGSADEADLAEILQATRRAKELVNQILTFSRKSGEARVPVQVHLLVGEALKLLRKTIPANIAIEQDLAKGGDTVLADPTQLHQVVMNLCTNAHHALRTRGSVIRVSLAEVGVAAGEAGRLAVPAGRYVRLRVEDDGEGMTPGTLAKALEPFFTTKHAGEGTGLGLSVVHGIVQAHDGAIAIESRPGEGTRVDVFLPAHAAAADEAAAAAAELRTGSERILVVDDEPQLAKIMGRMLEGLGYRVETFVVSSDALAAFVSSPDAYDLVITDQTMPGMTGAVLTTELLRLRPDLPVIICTGYSETMDERRATDVGARALVFKPVELERLSRVVRDALDRAG